MNDSAEGMLGSLAFHDAPLMCQRPSSIYFCKRA